MPNLTSILNEQIRRLARREVTANTKVVRKATAEYRHAIAALKRQVADLTKRLALLEKRQPTEAAASPEVLEKARFRAMGVRAHRKKLGLSAMAYGRLVGVSPLTIYQWESGKATPRQAQKARWLAIRALGKREALQRLGLGAAQTTVASAAPAAKPRFRGQFKQTAEAMILALLKGHKALTTQQLAAAWQRAGRGGKVDNTLSRMVKARKLRRTPLGGKQGSTYRLR